MKVQLKKALKHKGQELTELDIPLEELTGSDLIEVEKQIADANDKKALILPEFSKSYLATVASRAAHIPVEVLQTLSARDFTAMTNAVQNFLTGSDSDGQDGLVPPEAQGRAVSPAAETAQASHSKG